METKKYLAENTITKWFIRGLTGIVLLAYMYRIVVAVVTKSTLSFDNQDWTIMMVSVSIWIAFEAVVGYLKKKAARQSE